MKWENRQILRDTLVGTSIVDVVFHDSHGLIIDLVLNNGKTISVCTYESDDPKRLGGNFYVGINKEEL